MVAEIYSDVTGANLRLISWNKKFARIGSEYFNRFDADC
jgi:hypothetical protein